MSNGHVCCFFAVCCPPEAEQQRAQALYEEWVVQRGLASSDSSEAAAGRDFSRWVIKTFDLVPKGVGEAIVRGYAPEFAKKHAGKPTPEL